MKRKTLGIAFAVVAVIALGFFSPETRENTTYAQCASASFGAAGCSSGGGFSSYGAPMMYSAPMYRGPVYNSAGACLNCGRVHGPVADPFINVQPPRVNFGLINIGRAAPRYVPPAANRREASKLASARYAPPPVVAPKRIEHVEKSKAKMRWSKMKFKVDSYTGICMLK